MQIILNGKEYSTSTEKTLLDLVTIKNLNKDRVIIQVDEEIIKKENFKDHLITDDNRIEILSIVGGG